MALKRYFEAETLNLSKRSGSLSLPRNIDPDQRNDVLLAAKNSSQGDAVY
jgi:hypothetical protein